MFHIQIFILLLIASLDLGCGVTVPVSEKPVYHSRDLGLTSNSLLRCGKATSQDVIARWGKPPYRTVHDRAMAYLFETKTGTFTGIVWGPCMPGLATIDVYDRDDVWLKFDERNVLTRYEIGTRGLFFNRVIGKSDKSIWLDFLKNVPDVDPSN